MRMRFRSRPSLECPLRVESCHCHAIPGHMQRALRDASPLAILLVATIAVTACGKSSPTYSKSCATPLAGWNVADVGIPEIASRYAVRLDERGQVFWGDVKVSQSALQNFLRKTNTEPGVRLLLAVDADAPCAAVLPLRTMMNDAAQCSRLGRCYEGTGWPVLPNTPPPTNGG